MVSKYYRILLLALPLMAGCVRNQPITPTLEIGFQTAMHQTKGAIAGSVFPENESFGAYAWTDGTISDYFMNNERITYDASTDKWKPSTTYYWPKKSTVDFVCYYPYGMAGVTIGPAAISYKGIDVNNMQEDILYADKAAGYDSSTDAVPVVFHHALALVKVDVSMAYNHKEEADGTVTDWEITLNGASLSELFKTGDCNLSIAKEPSSGIVPWDRPKDKFGYHVWDTDSTYVTVPAEVPDEGVELSPDSWYNVIPQFFVLPQTLHLSQQMVNLDVTVVTSRNGEPFLRETITLNAPVYSEAVPAWQMNQSITYKIMIAPTASMGDGGDPSNPVDPSNPDLNDVIVTFDPSVGSWDVVGVTASLVM